MTIQTTHCDAESRYRAVSEVVGGNESRRVSNSTGQEFWSADSVKSIKFTKLSLTQYILSDDTLKK